MRAFRQELLSLSAEDMQLLAAQLLDRLGADAQTQAAQAQREFINAETAQPAAYEFAEGYAQQALPGFDEIEAVDYPSRQFLDDERRELPDRSFAEGYAPDKGGADFLEMAMPAARQRDFLQAQPQVGAGYDTKGGGISAEPAADRIGSMEEISDFFRRDGRRYDGGFKQY